MQYLELNGIFVNNFILYDDEHTVLMDTGFLNGLSTIAHALKSIGRSWDDVDAILLTHGHFDHAVHLHKIKALTQAPIYCTQEEQQHINGTFPYKGWNRITGWLEALGRFVFRYRPVNIDIHVKENDVLPFFGGMEIVALPGHSIGHIGYLHQGSKHLFIGDFVDPRRRTMWFPPFIFNSFPELFPISIRKVGNMDLNGLISNHGPRMDAGEQLRRYQEFMVKWRRKQGE